MNNRLYKLLTILLTLIFFIFGNVLSDLGYFSLVDSINKSSVNLSKNTNQDKKNELNLKWIDENYINNIYNIINKNYYSFDYLKNKELTYWVAKWLVDALWDKHSEFFTPEEAQKFNEVLNWDFEWIGAIIQKNDLWVQISKLIDWSPAWEAGLKPLDIIIKANWEELKWLELSLAVAKIKWPAWSKVKLEILRSWEKEILNFEVTRKKIEVPTVESKVIDWNGYIYLNIFWENSDNEFNKALENLYSQNIKWLIIDLRDNSGWILDRAVTILSNFIEKEKILVTTKEKNVFNNRTYFSEWNIKKNLPIVLLINGNSASASEITAWALKDYQKAILVWEKSYWKWSVQRPFELQDWSELKITIAKWYTPNDKWIDWIGINPDIEVKYQKEDFDKKYDRQLEEAKKILNKFIELKDINKTIQQFTKKIENSWTWTTLSGSTQK